eukprot:42498-Prorocentrum_lima.AAC.1
MDDCDDRKRPLRVCCRCDQVSQRKGWPTFAIQRTVKNSAQYIIGKIWREIGEYRRKACKRCRRHRQGKARRPEKIHPN